jgi:hypothetical protein
MSTESTVTLQDLQTKVDTLTTNVGNLMTAVEKSNEQARTSPFGLPSARRGEDPLTSRGYSYMKLFQLMNKQADPARCKVELEMHNNLKKTLYDGMGYTQSEANSILAPFSTKMMPVDVVGEKFVSEVRDIVKAGVAGYDPYEVQRIRSVVSKALSWQDEGAMGALVAPPGMGELIDLLRAREVFMRAGAQMIPMPPSGRFVWPRQTGASTAYWVGESKAITESEPTTGDIVLQAKKLGTIVKLPNELFRYASVNAEQFVRADMMKVMGLELDKTLLESAGSALRPKGLITYANIGTHTSSGTPADGNSGYPIQPEDITKMIGKVEERNATFNAWVMRPLLYTRISNYRWSTVTANDGQGGFMFSFQRMLGEKQHQHLQHPDPWLGREHELHPRRRLQRLHGRRQPDDRVRHDPAGRHAVPAGPDLAASHPALRRGSSP